MRARAMTSAMISPLKSKSWSWSESNSEQTTFPMFDSLDTIFVKMPRLFLKDEKKLAKITVFKGQMNYLSYLKWLSLSNTWLSKALSHVRSGQLLEPEISKHNVKDKIKTMRGVVLASWKSKLLLWENGPQRAGGELVVQQKVADVNRCHRIYHVGTEYSMDWQLPSSPEFSATILITGVGSNGITRMASNSSANNKMDGNRALEPQYTLQTLIPQPIRAANISSYKK
ncbi:unnamed protein product [Dovyalis caffra]|uniref:Uncharacterized protein n=1 Tax=Dovyalis caffra TaxID=77055 RepID=A0AAV1SCX1_9ROSI|nr:unnamed protein product [Dovyalis caffra]